MTTLANLKMVMDAAADKHGEYSMQVLDLAETLHHDFDDIEYLGNHRGEEARWGSRDHHVYRLADGTLVGVQWYNGATESQESFYEGVVTEVEERTTVTYHSVKKS